MARILLFGGSFDPVHKGHLHAARKAYEAVGADLLVVIPANVAPLKERSLSPAKDRVAMLRLALRTLKGVKHTISTYEIAKGGVSYTYDTVRHFKKVYKGDELFLLIGSDQLNQFDLWKNAHLFQKMCTVVCVRRTSAVSAANVKKYGIALLGSEAVEASSTDLRSRVNQQTNVPQVTRYINEHLLYVDERVRKWQSEKRWAHTLSVAATVAKIAKANKLPDATVKKAVVAAYYHDLAKDFTNEDLVRYAKKYIPRSAGDDPETLHALVGADYVVRFYGMEDRQVVQAIANHTMPLSRPLTAIDKLLYVADKVEPLRHYPHAPANYRLALRDYAKAFARVYCEQYERFNKRNAPNSGPAWSLYARLKGGR